MKKKDPKVGTGKKPKGTGRRLYTDENPKDTVPIKFATVADAQATARKVKRINKPYARKIQILTVVEQRAKVAGKPRQAAIAKRAKQELRAKHEAKKGATKKKMTRQIQNKLKKVAKGLSKASKTHAKQAKTIQSVLKTKKKK